MEALLFAHIEWRSEAHATSYSEWNGLFLEMKNTHNHTYIPDIFP